MDNLCPHCLLRPPHRDRLCFPCQFAEPRRLRWYAPRALPESPCRFLPGSEGKVACLEQRRQLGCNLWHPHDARAVTFTGPVWEIILAVQLQRILDAHRSLASRGGPRP